jgi:hypothetical protein
MVLLARTNRPRSLAENLSWAEVFGYFGEQSSRMFTNKKELKERHRHRIVVGPKFFCYFGEQSSRMLLRER